MLQYLLYLECLNNYRKHELHYITANHTEDNDYISWTTVLHITSEITLMEAALIFQGIDRAHF